MFDRQLLLFAGVAAILTITPGADTMMVMRSVLSRGPRAGVMATFGVCSGVFVHACLSALGVSALLVHSPRAFQALKLMGAGYLIYLGVQSVRRAARRPAEIAAAAPGREGGGARPWRSYREGLLTNVLNPKVSVFYLAFLPQFIGPGDPVLAKSVLLAAIHFSMGIVWLLTVVFSMGKLGHLLSRPAVQRRLEAFTGVVLVGFGVRLAMARR
jgi:RhtB (resistance to homoserine/threonine) family protein